MKMVSREVMVNIRDEIRYKFRNLVHNSVHYKVRLQAEEQIEREVLFQISDQLMMPSEEQIEIDERIKL